MTMQLTTFEWWVFRVALYLFFVACVQVCARQALAILGLIYDYVRRLNRRSRR